MRSFLIFIFLIGGSLWMLDAHLFDGRYSNAVWREAQAQSQQITYEVRRLLDKVTLGH
jgi:hypothetical protein